MSGCFKMSGHAHSNPQVALPSDRVGAFGPAASPYGLGNMFVSQLEECYFSLAVLPAPTVSKTATGPDML